MRRILACLAAAAVLATSTPLAANGDGAALQQVIRDQIAAFQKDDFDAAFEFASPAIRRIFGSPERFGQMVRRGYPMVHRPSELRFLEARQGSRSSMLQRVMVTDTTGRVHLLEYEMVARGGTYLINGVRILRGAEAGV